MSHRLVSWRLSLVAIIYTLSSDSTFRCSGVHNLTQKAESGVGFSPHIMPCFRLQWTVKTCVKHVIPSPVLCCYKHSLVGNFNFQQKKTCQWRFRISWKLSIIIPRSMKYDCINFERKHMFIYSFGLNPQFFNLEYQKQSPFLQIVLKIPDWYLTEIIFNLMFEKQLSALV